MRNLAKRFKVSLTFVQRLIKLYQETGTITPRKRKGGRKSLLNHHDLHILANLRHENPQQTLKELVLQLEKRSQKKISISTMHRALLKLEPKENLDKHMDI